MDNSYEFKIPGATIKVEVTADAVEAVEAPVTTDSPSEAPEEVAAPEAVTETAEVAPEVVA